MKRPFKHKRLKQLNRKNENQKNQNNNWKNFSKDIDENIKMLKNYLGSSQDVMFTEFTIDLTHENHLKAVLIAIDGLVDEQAKRDNIIKPLIEPPLDKSPNEDLEAIRSRLSVKSAETEENLVKATNNVLQAQALLIIDGFPKGLLISIEGFEMRAIEEPESERIVRGSHEGFIESVSVNLSMIRRRIAHSSLRFETMKIGEYSQTDITVAYVKDIADPKLVDRVKKRLSQIRVDNINSSGDIEQLIEDHPYSIFPTIGNTERSDQAAALLMEGRIFLLVNGDPVTLFVPFQFIEGIKDISDYNSRPYYTSFIRLIRLFAFIISITLPGIYISAVNFNKGLIPSDLVVPLTVAREAVPFPLVLEVIIMVLMFEVVREAGVRLPKQVGTAVSIVGPLILGDVAVSSSLVGAPTVIIVSISYIASFVITSIAGVTALLRLALLLAASLFGSFGMVVMLLATFTHMVSLTSLGVPYMVPFAPVHFRDWKDAFVRFPTRLLKRRPNSIPNQRSKKIKQLPDTEDKQ